ncbi:MAG TPA: hypothetical protein VGR63_12560 [Casimicrobiaceae bacterium]|jgi:hypothetical protein|nr:hypothetical protein [Casimicrobiaceae bacterium]
MKHTALHHRCWILLASLFAAAAISGPAAAKSELKGAAALDHPCAKVGVQQMGYLHAGNIDAANRLSTPEMQQQWQAMPAKDRTMMAEMAKSMSPSSDQYAAEIRKSGMLVVDGAKAVLTVQTTHKDANGSSTSTSTQNFRFDGKQCLVSR